VAAKPAIVLSDLVASTGPRGQENILLGGLTLRVASGEHVLLAVDTTAERDALMGILTGRRRPTYGRVDPPVPVLPSVTAPDVPAPGGPCVGYLPDGVPAEDWYRTLRETHSATLLIGTGSALAGLPGDRRLRLVDGYVRAGTAASDSPARPELVPPAEVWVAAGPLRERVVALLTEAGTPADTAQLVADVLVDADVRGHASHGVQLTPMYLDRVANGGIRPAAAPMWLARQGSVRLIDAAGGFGQVAARLAAEECARVAAESGIVAVGVRGNNHVGMLAAYREPFLRHGVVGLILNISGVSVAAPGAGKASMGNNAVCLINPYGPDAQPLIVDFATGTVASGKIRDAAARGRPVPRSWLVDRTGAPTTDPNALDAGGAVPVFGGYKGLGVSLIVEVLAGMLAGQTVSPLVHKQRQQPGTPMNCSQLFLGLHPPAFQATGLDELTGILLDSVGAGYDGHPPEVYLPEQQERRRTRSAEARGVSLPAGLARRLGLEPTAAQR
jgi:LDH2 family malate/lactate/ureidoglycolate dehydrogenase